MIQWLAHKLGLKSCPECDTLVDYAMDGLAESQHGKVREHLSQCPRCREQVRDYWQVREGLGLCAREQDAPEDLCAKVLARLGESPQERHSAPPASPAAPARLEGWPRFWMMLGPSFAALSLVMTAVALAALMDRRPVALVAPAPGNELAAIADAIMDDPRAAHVVLAAAGPSAAASGLLVLCPGMDHAYFHCEHLSRCPLGNDYVLWMQPQGGAPLRLARFTVEREGSSVHLLQFDSAFQAHGPVQFMVTQQGGADPPGRTWLKGSVSL